MRWVSFETVRNLTKREGGKETSLMARLLGDNAHLVSYGAMSKQPLLLPTSLFIFKNLTAHGFWQTRWYLDKSREERERFMETLIDLMRTGRVRLTNMSSWAVLTNPCISVQRTTSRDCDRFCEGERRRRGSKSERCHDQTIVWTLWKEGPLKTRLGGWRQNK